MENGEGDYVDTGLSHDAEKSCRKAYHDVDVFGREEGHGVGVSTEPKVMMSDFHETAQRS